MDDPIADLIKINNIKNKKLKENTSNLNFHKLQDLSGNNNDKQRNKNSHSRKGKARMRKISFTKKLGLPIHRKKRTINQFCNNYKYNTFGKENKNLFESCKVNQYCRRYKCKDIDRKFNLAKTKKIGVNNNAILITSLFRKCPIGMNNKNRKNCVSKATKKFYDENDLGDMYSKVLECDKNTCSKERKIFHTNIFRIKNKHQKRIRIKPLINLEELPDQEMIEKN
jgi:hypothetical protein